MGKVIHLSQPALNKPSSCEGCDLHPHSTGFMNPTLATNGYKVALVGEALGESEVEEGSPFVGKAGFKLTRLIEWAGLDRAKFDIWNVAWCRPPQNKLEGEWYEKSAVQHCRAAHWENLLRRVNVVVPMGNVPLAAFTGRKGITKERGYISPGPLGTHLVPTVHPSFIQRGQSKYSAAFIHDIQKAVLLAETGLQFERTDYLIDPRPGVALEWARKYRERLDADPTIRLAYDIETPGKGDDEGDLEDEEDGDRTYFIWRIGFAYQPGSALTVPWTPEYIPSIKLILGSGGEKVVWNAGFDNPRIRHNGVEINGLVHDGMVAWHILHSDLPKGLGFVATFTCPFQPAWKHLSHSQPGFYNCTDADVELKSFLKIERELLKTGLYDVYRRDVIDLDPILIHMSQKGMPIDHEVRLDRAIKLDELQKNVIREMEVVIPEGVRKVEVYERTPKDTTGLVVVRVERPIKRCSVCGLENPTKPHFKTFKRPTAARPQNPCGGGEVTVRVEEVERFAWVAPFKPSRQQLMTYQGVMGRPVPTTYDKKTKSRKPSMGEKQIKELMVKYPDDKLYPLVLKYREIDKLAGTYIGRPVYEDDPSPTHIE